MCTLRIPLLAAAVACLLVLSAPPATSLPNESDEPGPGPGNQEDIPETFPVKQPYVSHPLRSDSVPQGTGLVAGFHSDAENEAEGLQRRNPNGPWVDIVGLGYHPDGVRHVDRDIQPDTRYCYRTVARRGDLTHSGVVLCKRTLGAQAEPVLRLQVKLGVADVSDAGTGNGSVSADVGVGATTWLDRPGDDFTRGSSSSFDLPPVRNMSDIEHLVIRNHSDDDMCVRSLGLDVNETQVFAEYFGDEDCIWIGRDTKSVFHISGDELRASALWSYPALDLRLAIDTQTRGPLYNTDDREVAVLHLPANEVQERLESSLGSVIGPTPGPYWGDSGRVGLSRYSDEKISIDADLAYDINNWFDPSVNLKAKLEFARGVDSAGRPRLTAVMKDLQVSTDADPIFDVVFEILPLCRFLWAMITHDDFKSCIDQITEWKAADFLNLARISQSILTTSVSQCCADVFAVVQPDTSVDVVFVLGDPPVDDPAPRPPPPPWDIDDIDPKGNGTGFPGRGGDLRSNAGSRLTAD